VIQNSDMSILQTAGAGHNYLPTYLSTYKHSMDP